MKEKNATPMEQNVSFYSKQIIVNGEIMEIIPAFSKFSLHRGIHNKIMDDVEVEKLLPTIFPFTKPDIFRNENIQLVDFNGKEIPHDIDDNVLVYLDKADNLNLFGLMKEPLPSIVVECENVADAYLRVSSSMALSQLPQKGEWFGLCVATTNNEVLSQILQFVNKNKVNGTVAEHYFNLRCTIAKLKKATITQTSPWGDKVKPRSLEEAELLYSKASDMLSVKTASQTRIAKALNQSVQKYSLEEVVQALDDIKVSDQKIINEAPCDLRGEELISYISEWVGKQSVKVA